MRRGARENVMDNKIVLEMSLGKYNKIHEMLDKHTTALARMGAHDLIKQSLTTDVSMIRDLIKSSKKGDACKI